MALKIVHFDNDFLNKSAELWFTCRKQKSWQRKMESMIDSKRVLSSAQAV